MSKMTIFGADYEIDMSIVQMERIASDLIFLLKHSGLNRSELATKLGCKKSRVTRILSGDENLTIKTLTSVSESLGYGFEVVFYNKSYPKPKQPWTIDRENKKIITAKLVNKPKIFNLELQTGNQVVSDVLAGNESDRYIKITECNKNDIKYLRKINNNHTLSVLPTSHKTFKYDLTNKVVDYEY